MPPKHSVIPFQRSVRAQHSLPCDLHHALGDRAIAVQESGPDHARPTVYRRCVRRRNVSGVLPGLGALWNFNCAVDLDPLASVVVVRIPVGRRWRDSRTIVGRSSVWRARKYDLLGGRDICNGGDCPYAVRDIEFVVAMEINAQYNVAKPNSYPARVAAHQRRKMFCEFVQLMNIGDGDSILDIGATSDRSYDHSNYLEAWYPNKAAVTAVGIDDAS